MQHSRLKSSFLAVLTIWFCSLATAQQGVRLESMQLLTSETGWAATNDKLLRTENGGRSWRDITPGANYLTTIASVYFLNDSVGWVVLDRGNDEGNDVSRFAIARTSDGGRNWAVGTIPITGANPDNPLPGDVRMRFLDAQHGWINFGGAGSAAFNGGFLMATTDGGKTWYDVPGDFEAGGRGGVSFATIKDGWFTNGMEIYASWDSGKSWKAMSLKAPKEAGPAINPAYDAPVFRDATHGFLAVTYSSAYDIPEARSALVFFSSSDAGKTWTPEHILENLPLISTGEIMPTTLAGTTWFTARVSDHDRLTLTKIPHAGKPTTLASDAAWNSAVLQLSFTSEQRGWLLTSSGLLSTSNGGTTWKDVTPSAPFDLPKKRR